MTTRPILCCLALFAGGCSCELDPCDLQPPPSFRVEGTPVSGAVVFPAEGRVTVEASFASTADASLSLSGPFEQTVLGQHRLRVRASEAGRGVVEAHDAACNQTARLELEAAPVDAVRLSSETLDAIPSLPEPLIGGGVALLPGFPLDFTYELVDAEGRVLVGSLDEEPTISLSGGLELLGRERPGEFQVAVIGPAGPASIELEGAPPIELAVAQGDEAVRLEIWRQGQATLDRWWDAWLAATPVDESIDVAIGTPEAVALHPFDAEGRLLLGPDLSVEPLAIDSEARSFLESLRAFPLADGLLLGKASGETEIVARKAGATAVFRVRVSEP